MVQWTLEQKNPDNVSCSFGCGYLFLDVCGFTRLTETASAKGHYGVEVITNLLNEYFDLLNSQIMRAGGQIIKFEGDAVLAAFPDSENACHITIKKCVEDIKQGLKKLNQRLESTYGSDLAFHSSMVLYLQYSNFGKEQKALDYFVLQSKLSIFIYAMRHTGKKRVFGNKCVIIQLMISNSYNHNLQIPQSSELSYDHLFFPPEVLQRISSESFSGELRNAAILFIGINAEILIRKSDYKTLNKYYSSVQDIVYRLGGMINKIDYTDKGLILLISFGILQTHIDDIERAIICANQINKLKSPLKAKIGLTYSNLYAGILGGQQRYEFGIIGNGVNVAARLMTSAKYGQIVFTKDILPSVQSRFEVQFLRKDKVKGIKGELEFYHIVRELPEYLNSYKKQYDDKTQVFYQNETESIIKKIASKKLSQLLISGEHGTGKSFISWKIISSFYAKASKIAIIVLDEFNRHDFLILHRKFISKSLGIDDPLAEPDKLKEYLYNLMDKRDSDILLQALGLQNQGSKQIIDSEKHKDLVLLSLYKSLYILMKDLDIVLLDNIQWLDDLSNQIIQKRLEEETIITTILIMTSTMILNITKVIDQPKLHT
jgi:class 3 adenylate cyclase